MKIDNIKTLFDINGGIKSYENSILNIIDAVKHLIPNYKELEQDDLTNLTNEILNEIIPVYDKYFTDEEILGIIEFYKTDIGKAYLNKMGIVTMECMQISNKMGEIIYKKLVDMNQSN